MRNKLPISLNVVRDLPDLKGKHFAGSFTILSDFQCQKKKLCFIILFTYSHSLQKCKHIYKHLYPAIPTILRFRTFS